MGFYVERMEYSRGPTVAILIVGVPDPSTNRMQWLSQGTVSYVNKPRHHVEMKSSFQAANYVQSLMIPLSILGVVSIVIILNLLMADLALICTEDYMQHIHIQVKVQNATFMALHFTCY